MQQAGFCCEGFSDIKSRLFIYTGGFFMDLKKKQTIGSAHVRGKFSGRIGYVLAVAGSAVGLGNIWRFPYLAAKYGGGMFLLIYLI